MPGLVDSLAVVYDWRHKSESAFKKLTISVETLCGTAKAKSPDYTAALLKRSSKPGGSRAGDYLLAANPGSLRLAEELN